jgi:cystathionine gamma-synthase
VLTYFQAVSVSLPSWKATVGYEEGQDWVVSKMKTGYPRFFIHLTIQELEKEILHRYGSPGESTMLFPSVATAERCKRFLIDRAEGFSVTDVRTLVLMPASQSDASSPFQTAVSSLYCILFPADLRSIVKQVWQHSGDGISSRRGEFCLKALRDGLLIPEGSRPVSRQGTDQFCRGPRRYQRRTSMHGIQAVSDGVASGVLEGGSDYSQFVEERFGRNLNAKLASKAKLAIRRRIAGCLTDNSELDQALESSSGEQSLRVHGLTEDDVYLYPTGMSSIFNTHRILMANCRASLKSICFGFPYIDTLKVLQKWGPGCLFYGKGQDSDLDDLERRLQNGERYLALFTEFPSNPLLNSPNLHRIRQLADKYDFALVVDESIGNFINVNVLALADVVVSSLTKIFSGDANVMGGSAILNPRSRMYHSLKKTLEVEYENNYWAEDAVFMERNSLDFVSRIERINANATAFAEKLRASPLVKQVYYPLFQDSRIYYDACRTPKGGYGGLLSVTFRQVEQAVAFFDALEVYKGPSLGTNFTLACPYTILAHYGELDWAASCGVDADLVRVSCGLEESQDMEARVERALKAAERVTERGGDVSGQGGGTSAVEFLAAEGLIN